MNGLPSSQVCVLMEDGNHQAMLRLYHTACSHNLEISDLVITDSLDIDGMVRRLDDANICTCYATIRTAIDEGTGLVSSVFAHTVGEVCVGLMGLVCSTLQACGQYIAEASRRGIISTTGKECMQCLSFILWRAGSFHIWGIVLGIGILLPMV